MSYTEHMRGPAFSYLSINNRLKREKTKAFGPMKGGWIRSDGTPDPEMRQVAEIVVDLDINDNVIGVEFLVDTDLTYEVLCEESTPGPYCAHSMFNMTCIPCAHRHLWLLQQPIDPKNFLGDLEEPEYDEVDRMP